MATSKPIPPVLEMLGQLGMHVGRTVAEGGAEALLEEAQDFVAGLSGRLDVALEKVGQRRRGRRARVTTGVAGAPTVVVVESAETVEARKRRRRRRD
jgi:xanthosine utilization system XapX-like protein